MGRRLGVDVGDVRVGVATCDPEGLIATPVETVPAGPGCIPRVVALAEEYAVIEVVVGFPLSLSGREGPAATKVRAFATELAPLRTNALEGHPWRAWASMGEASGRMPGGQSRWSAGKDLSWEPLRIERVCEVKYDHLQGDRFRHATQFVRWRPDKRPADCRYDQLEVTPPAELAEIFGRRRR